MLKKIENMRWNNWVINKSKSSEPLQPNNVNNVNNSNTVNKKPKGPVAFLNVAWYHASIQANWATAEHHVRFGLDVWTVNSPDLDGFFRGLVSSVPDRQLTPNLGSNGHCTWKKQGKPPMLNGWRWQESKKSTSTVVKCDWPLFRVQG